MAIHTPAPTPAAAAWVEMAEDPGVLVGWLRDQAPGLLSGRVTVVPRKSHLDMAGEAVQAFAANKNVHSGRGTRGTPGGPVLAYHPDHQLLGDAVALADGQALGVIEFQKGEVGGWAAATNAVDLATGEPTPSVPAEIHEALVDLRDAGYNGYFRDREPFFAAKYFPPIDDLLAAGYDYNFVASYLVALGVDGRSVGEDLKRIYVPSDLRRKLKKR